MADRLRLLLLGGTREAADLAAAAAADPNLEVISSLAGRTRRPGPIAGTVRVGGFGGADGLAGYLRQAEIDLLVDATHPFAATMSRHAAAATVAAGVPRLTIVRPPWRAEPGDHWTTVADAAAAAAALAERARRAFLTVGRREIPAFAGLTEVWFLVRLIDPPEPPPALARHRIVVGRPPFAEGAEIALLVQHRIDTLVAKNSGGEWTYGKIAAARHLGLPVVMLRRPPPPSGETVTGVADALAWIERHLL